MHITLQPGDASVEPVLLLTASMVLHTAELHWVLGDAVKTLVAPHELAKVAAVLTERIFLLVCSNRCRPLLLHTHNPLHTTLLLHLTCFHSLQTRQHSSAGKPR